MSFNLDLREHIIPNAIGGRKKTTSFICESCNIKFGETWDAELARQVNWFSLAVGIRRERGESPRQVVQTVSGERLWLHSDGTFTPEKSSHSETDVSAGIQINMTAQTIDEARKRLKGVARKCPKFDVKKALEEMKIKTSFLDSPLHVSLHLGGPCAGRSLVKTAFSFASDCGVEHDQCELAKEYLTNAELKAIPFGFAYISDLVERQPMGNVFHCVSLRADPKTKQIYSCIEYFGLFRVLVFLGKNYDGPFRSECYSLNPVDGASANIRVKEVVQEEFFEIMAGKGFDQEKHKVAADYAFPIILDRARSRTLEHFVRQGFEHAGRSFVIKEGEDIPREKAEEFAALMMEKLSPYIENLVRDDRSIQDY
ncbi:MAG: hypothetical protein NTX37_04675 [Burkholderiales bacterium]|jgi:hypothetical protein|nr:hypothetical protein [Burkholderiales bacterium]